MTTTNMDAGLNRNSNLAQITFHDSGGCIKNDSTVYQLILEKSWNAVVEHCRVAPEEAKQWIMQESDNDSWRRLPLHEACIRQATINVVRALVDAYPFAAQCLDHSARLPLHHACFHGCSIEVIRLLVGVYPSGLVKKDVFGKTPLVLAESSSSIEDKSLIMDTLIKGPAECIIKFHRSIWEKEQKALLSTLHNEFHRERSALEYKLMNLSEDFKNQTALAEMEVWMKNVNIAHLNTVILELNTQVESLAAVEKTLRERMKETEDKFSNLIFTSDVTAKNQLKKIQEQANTIASLEADIEELNKTVILMTAKVNVKEGPDLISSKPKICRTMGENNNVEELYQQETWQERQHPSNSYVLALGESSALYEEKEKEIETLQEQSRNMNVKYEETINLLKRSELEKESLKKELDNLKRKLVGKENAITFMKETSMINGSSSLPKVENETKENEKISTRKLAYYLLSVRRIIHSSWLLRTVRNLLLSTRLL
jgi:hypothetical protein